MKNEKKSLPYATKSFFSLTSMYSSRYTHGCGTISAQDGSGNKEVVAAGEHKLSDDTVEIYSIADDSWREGNIQLMVLK